MAVQTFCFTHGEMIQFDEHILDWVVQPPRRSWHFLRTKIPSLKLTVRPWKESLEKEIPNGHPPFLVANIWVSERVSLGFNCRDASEYSPQLARLGGRAIWRGTMRLFVRDVQGQTLSLQVDGQVRRGAPLDQFSAIVSEVFQTTNLGNNASCMVFLRDFPYNL